MKKTLIIVGLIMAIVIGFITYNYWFKGEAKEEPKGAVSFVNISINPNVELALDDQDKVTEVIPINEDADIITSDLDLVGLDIEEASDKIIASSIDTGFIDEYSSDNTVVVTTASDDEDTRKTLEEKIMTRLNNHLESKKVYAILVAKGLDDDLKEEALEYNVSNGKMLLIEEAVALNPSLSKSILASSSIQSIQREIKNYVKERHATLKESLADLKAKWKSEKATLRQNYINKVKQLRVSISLEKKEEFKSMTPAQKEAAITNYLNNKKEEIKNEINAIKEELKNELKGDMQGYNYPILKNNADEIRNNIKNRIQERRNNR
jgi:predicted transcriptional regulator